jgi:hypothetical protein
MDLPQKKNFLFEKNFKKLSQKIASQSNTKKRKLKMALRLLPFRQYIEQDVINLYSLDTTEVAAVSSVDPLTNPALNGENDSGVVVKITEGDFDKGIEYDFNETYLGKTDYPHIGGNGYPKVTGMQIAPADKADAPLGITLRQTLTHDENGEKLLYYRQKMIELQAVLPGEVVPVLTRGVVTLAASAFVSSEAPEIGAAVYTGAGGKLSDVGTDGVRIGKCIASGTRKAYGTPDQFAGDPNTSSYTGAAYYVIKIEL